MAELDRENWPIRTKQAAIEEATAIADSAAADMRMACLRVARVNGRLWRDMFRPDYELRFAECLVHSPGAAGNVLFRWAGARGFHELDPTSFEEQPAHVRLPFDVFAATFHAVLQVLVGEVASYEARRTAAIFAALQRTPIRETIFETDKDDGPFHHMGPRGAFTPPARHQAEAMALSAAAPGAAQADPPAAAPEAAPDPLTSSPAGDDHQVAGSAPGPAGGAGYPAPLDVSSPDSGAGSDQPPAPLSRKRKG